MNAVARHELLARRFESIRATSLDLIETLSPEDCAAQSMPDASPAKWHLAHTTWFFETFVLKPEPRPSGAEAFSAFDPRYEMLFNSYYNYILFQNTGYTYTF